MLLPRTSGALIVDIACARALYKIKKTAASSAWEDAGAHLEIVNALHKFLKEEPLSPVDLEIIQAYGLTAHIQYWKSQPRIWQKLKYWREMFFLKYTKDFKKNKAAYNAALKELNLLDRSGMRASLFVARHPLFMLFIRFMVAPYVTNSLYTQPLSEDEAEEHLNTPVPDDQVEYVFYPKHVAMRVRNEYFDIGNRKISKLEHKPIRPRSDGATFVRIQGDPGLAERILNRFTNYPENKKRLYQEWWSTCITNANDLMEDETSLSVPKVFSAYPSATEGYLKVLKSLGSRKIVQIKTLAPDEKFRKSINADTNTSWLYRTTKYSIETQPFALDLALIDELSDCAATNFPKEKQTK